MRRRTWVVAIGAVACLLAALGSSQALASTWTARQLSGEAGRAPLFAVSCPAASLCVAVGGGDTIAASGNPAGGAASWGVSYPGAGVGEPNQKQIRGVSCPSPQLCVAVTFEGLIYTSTNPTGGASAWSVTDLGGSGSNTHFYGISCPSPLFCAASAGGARIATSTNPTGGPSAWSIAQLEGPLELRGISCLSPALCVAVGDDGDNIRPAPGDNAAILVSNDPLGGAAAWQRPGALPAQGNLYGVSCPSPALCVSGDLFGNLLLSTNPAGAWTRTPGGGSVQITAADCPSASQCALVDNNGDVLSSTDPTGGPSAWAFTNVLPYPAPNELGGNALFGVSCPSASFCAVAANYGQILTSEDPFIPGPVPVEKNGKRKAGKHGPKRPLVTIAHAPEPAVRAPHGFRAILRFFANGRVDRFECKIDQRKFKPCRSPHSYRVGTGRHVFAVRALGLTGFRGPVKKTRFTVFTPRQWPPGTPAPGGKGRTCHTCSMTPP